MRKRRTEYRTGDEALGHTVSDAEILPRTPTIASFPHTRLVSPMAVPATQEEQMRLPRARPAERLLVVVMVGRLS